jgi:hypothetical protein
MRTLLCAVGVLLLVAGAVSPAEAKKQPRHAKTDARRAPAEPPANGYREQLADKIPMGTSAWWEQMRREGRLGGETP